MHESWKQGETRSCKRRRCCTCSHQITNSGNDGVQDLDFALQQHHSGMLSALLVGMVQHHVEKVTQLGGDAGVLEDLNLGFAAFTGSRSTETHSLDQLNMKHSKHRAHRPILLWISILRKVRLKALMPHCRSSHKQPYFTHSCLCLPTLIPHQLASELLYFVTTIQV